jgi:putative transposase
MPDKQNAVAGSSRSGEPPVSSIGTASLDARRMHDTLKAVYGPDAAESAREPAETWQSRRLESFYAMVFIDSLAVKVRERGLLKNRQIHLALGVLPDGGKDIIAFWITPARAEMLWPSAIDELKRRGVEDVLLAVVEEPAACADAISRAFPHTRIQSSIKHLVGRSLETVPIDDRETVKHNLSAVFGADDRAGAANRLNTFLAGDEVRRHPSVASYWQEHRSDVLRLFQLPAAVRELVRSTTAVDSLLSKLRRRGITKRASFASDDAAVRELIFALQDANASWKVWPNKWIAVRSELRLVQNRR